MSFSSSSSRPERSGRRSSSHRHEVAHYDGYDEIEPMADAVLAQRHDDIATPASAVAPASRAASRVLRSILSMELQSAHA